MEVSTILRLIKQTGPASAVPTATVMSIAILCVMPTMPGCASTYKRNAVPREFALTAWIDGLEEDRMTGDNAFRAGTEEAEHRKGRFLAQMRASGLYDDPKRYLAISGGGSNGAFGAGLLCGWTESGTRPEFVYVTGISTGALIAPFAFLGSEYDEVLEDFYTTTETKDLLEPRGLISAIMSDAFADTKGLYKTIQDAIDEDVIDAIAREHRRGRRLSIGTTNLDLMKPVYWSLSALAASDIPNKAELIHKVLLASASIPGAFPPVYFTVKAEDGNEYDEMHGDGGCVAQVFAYPLTLDLKTELDKMGISTDDQDLFIIRNAKLDPEHEIVEPKLFSITGRAISALLTSQGLGNLFTIYLGTLRDDIDFHLAGIPSDFDLEPKEAFDPVYMTALFQRGYEMARNGYPWANQPPGFIMPERLKDR